MKKKQIDSLPEEQKQEQPTRKQRVEAVFLQMLFTVPAIFIERVSLLILLTTIFLLVLQIANSFPIWQKMKNLYFYNGLMSLCFSIGLLITSMRIMLVILDWRAAAIQLCVYIMACMSIILFAHSSLRKKPSSRKDETSKISISLITLSSLLGIVAARSLTRMLPNDTMIILLSIMTMFVSICSSLGLINLVEFYFIRKLNT